MVHFELGLSNHAENIIFLKGLVKMFQDGHEINVTSFWNVSCGSIIVKMITFHFPKRTHYKV